jgi:hypothetical protein
MIAPDPIPVSFVLPSFRTINRCVTKKHPHESQNHVVAIIVVVVVVVAVKEALPDVATAKEALYVKVRLLNRHETLRQLGGRDEAL